jgi:ATP-binding cassette subfamily F protein uup
MKNPNFLILDEPTNDLDILTLNVLEEYLSGFKGCVIIVSHDRYFMDKVVDHIFEYKGDGMIRNFPGNYTQLREREDLLMEEEIAGKKSKGKLEEKPENYSGGKRSKKNGLSFSEKREYELLLSEIENLEKEKRMIESDLSNGMLNADDLLTKSKRHGEIVNILDEKELRWLYLSDKSG